MCSSGGGSESEHYCLHYIVSVNGTNFINYIEFYCIVFLYYAYSLSFNAITVPRKLLCDEKDNRIEMDYSMGMELLFGGKYNRIQVDDSMDELVSYVLTLSS